MPQSENKTEVYLEIGKKKTFAGVVDWPGWCRAGRDEQSALQALLDYAPRYARALDLGGISIHLPAGISDFVIVERLAGGASTDFGAPEMAPSADSRPFEEADLRYFQALLNACWQTYDAAAQAAAGKELRRGPRGGGRELEGISRHVLGSEEGYLTRLAWKNEKKAAGDLSEELARTRQAVLDALNSAFHNGVPERGPRGGKYWTPHYFVRRDAWHILDHAWEIEDRILDGAE